MMNFTASLLGAILCLTGLIGLFDHDFMGMVLNPLHDYFLLAMGAASLYFGINGTEFQARYMNRATGLIFGVLGVLTLMSGQGVANAEDVSLASTHVLKLFPGQLEYTAADGFRDLMTGFVGLLFGFFPREKEIEIDMAVQEKQLEMSKKR